MKRQLKDIANNKLYSLVKALIKKGKGNSSDMAFSVVVIDFTTGRKEPLHCWFCICFVCMMQGCNFGNRNEKKNTQPTDIYDGDSDLSTNSFILFGQMHLNFQPPKSVCPNCNIGINGTQLLACWNKFRNFF